ncbi:Anhydro-N-acetylmuramic acid kinase [Clostridium vincentii]|uniref:Anhydro-N-acetylmuramic acid kinase n=2 Tax=Clostridium vincentii TaxID=52704 RepID=A0A2T0BD98_9CLOT|nr:Anhydro-N-acetylmuramic acid kinase [Clostridium vincentii]
MSGTSLDGVDAALVDIEGSEFETKVKLVKFNTYEMPKEIKAEIKRACSVEESSVELICSLNFKLGYLFSKAVQHICEEAKVSVEKIDFVASHGQTIYHIPKGKGSIIPSTLQIGEPSVIAYENNLKVISNFRTMDMAAGGEGAPLVPYSEYILYGGRGETIAFQNIGGIGNVTVIPAKRNIDEIFAFDTGPGNMIIDEVCSRLFNVSYDKNGDIAKTGNINEGMLKNLMDHPYLKKTPPKTTGREDFGEDFVKNLLEKFKDIKPEDIVKTVTAYTAFSIVDSYKKFVLPKTKLDKVLLAGGGTHNKVLIQLIKDGLKGIDVFTQDEIGYSSDAKEAIAFAILGNETLNKKTSNVAAATGAKRNVILGNISLPPFGGS